MKPYDEPRPGMANKIGEFVICCMGGTYALYSMPGYLLTLAGIPAQWVMALCACVGVIFAIYMARSSDD